VVSLLVGRPCIYLLHYCERNVSPDSPLSSLLRVAKAVFSLEDLVVCIDGIFRPPPYRFVQDIWPVQFTEAAPL